MKIPLMEALAIPREKLRKRLARMADFRGEDCWLFAPRNREGKVCIVAHIDTVWDEECGYGFLFGKNAPQKKTRGKDKLLVHDREKGLIWSPDGLGADDRAGVYAALRLFDETPEPYRPYVLLTDYEESGGKGAREAASLFAGELAGCNFLVELDRANGKDAVFYSGEPEDFVQYIAEFGFKKANGSFSDISILSPALKRCGANLSIGYYHQHTEREYLNIKKMHSTIEKVKGILMDNHMKGQTWELEARATVLPDWAYDMWKDGPWGDEEFGIVVCPKCGEQMFEEELHYGSCVMCGTHIGEREERLCY